MRFFWHTHVENLRGSVVFPAAATTPYVRGSLLSPGPQQWSTFRKPACRTGGDAGAAPAGSTIGLMREQRPENRGAAVCVDCESNKEKVSQRLPEQLLIDPGLYQRVRQHIGLSLSAVAFRFQWRRAVTIHARELNQTPSSLICAASASCSRWTACVAAAGSSLFRTSWVHVKPRVQSKAAATSGP